MKTPAVLAFLVIFLIGCTPTQYFEPLPAPEPAQNPDAQPQTGQESGVVSQEPPQTPDAQPQTPHSEPPTPSPEPVEGQYDPVVEKTPAIASFRNTFLNDVKNYQFSHGTNQYKVKGKLVKIILGRVLQNQYNAPHLDVVYLDRSRKMALGVCEGLDQNIRRQCAHRGTLKQFFAVPYLQFAITFPEDWLEEFLYKPAFPAETPQLATERPTVHLKHSTQTRTTDFFFDPPSGLPVVVLDNGREYHYAKLSKNTVTETFLIE